MSSVLVTGGTGFIGSWVTRKLIDQGGRAVAYSRHPDTTLLKDIADRVDFAAGDVLDLPNLIHTMRDYKVERVIHMSNLVSEENPFLGWRINVEGALNVFEACRLMDIKRVVYISSKAVYAPAVGDYAHPTYKPSDEDYPKGPRNIYGATKLFMENMGLAYNRVYGLDFVALRFAHTWGVAKDIRHTQSVLENSIIESAMLKKPLKVSQDVVDLKNDWIYTKDIAKGIVLACFAENLEHRFFHLGGDGDKGKEVTYRHVIEIVNKIFGRVPIEIVPGLGTASLPPNPRIFNIDRARRELRYSPEYDLEKAIRDCIETMRRLNIS